MSIYQIFRRILTAIVIILLWTSCRPENSFQKDAPSLPESEIVFEVSIPVALNEGEKIFLELLDEVTGISINPSRYELQAKDDFNYFVRLQIINGSLVNYRYMKQTAENFVEHTPYGQKIHYRSYYAHQPSIVSDVITSWTGEEVGQFKGEISGYVYDEETNLPIPEMFISINGIVATSSSDGYYQIKGLPAGEYNLLAYHPEGLYEPFQQGAVIAENAVTPASFGMRALEIVEVTFEATLPEHLPDNAQVRLIGNTYSTGNMFSELDGGTSIIPARAPTMEPGNDGFYSIKLNLPSGLDFRYKYTLGNGFINSEIGQDEIPLTRQAIIPNKNSSIQDKIYSWSTELDSSPIVFSVSAPENTPAGDSVSIQFKPFDWTYPIPLWKTSENEWSYLLYGPFEYLANSQFRFCRNDQCGSADDEITAGINASGYILDIDDESRKNHIEYSIDKWFGIEQVSYDPININKRIDINYFIKGIAFEKKHDPSWLPYLEWGFVEAAVGGANTIIFSPTWFFDNTLDPRANKQPGKDAFFKDIDAFVSYAHDADLKIFIYPQPSFSDKSNSEYWVNAPRTYNWWMEWFNLYERFILSYAEFAEDNDIETFIIGGKYVAPALPAGRLPDDTPSNTPYDYSTRWQDLIDKVKTLYTGRIILSLPDAAVEGFEQEFLQSIDMLMVESISGLSTSDSPAINEMALEYTNLLDGPIYQLHSQFSKPMIIALNFASLDGSGSNCANLGTTCAELIEETEFDSIPIDLEEQADIYSAILNVVGEREWITGVITQGFHPAVAVNDASYSIRGKPAMDVLSRFFTN